MAIKHPFTPRELLNSHNLDVMSRVAALFESPIARDRIILEGLGTWLEQGAWTDTTGFYMTIRMHPLYKHLQDTQEAGRTVTRGFLAAFPGRTAEPRFEGQEGYAEGEPVTVFVTTSTHSIGD